MNKQTKEKKKEIKINDYYFSFNYNCRDTAITTRLCKLMLGVHY